MRPRRDRIELDTTRQRRPRDDGAVDPPVTAPIVVLAGGWTSRSLVYREGRVPTTTYRDRYFMSDIPVPDRPDADTAVVNLAPGGVLESFPLPGSMRRVVAWDAAADPAVDLPEVRVQRLQIGAARPRRGIRRRCGPDRHRLRHPPGVRPAAAPWTAVRDRRCGARGEPHRRAGHEPRPAGCRGTRAPARALGARARCAGGRARGVGAPPRPLRRARRAGSPPSTPCSAGLARERPMPHDGRS